MLFKLSAVVLAFVVAAESAYIVVQRRPIDRFKPVEEFGYGIVALDTATGQLCKTLRTGPILASEHPTSSSDSSSDQAAGDPFIDEMNRASKGQVDDDATADFVRKLPACRDIR